MDFSVTRSSLTSALSAIAGVAAKPTESGEDHTPEIASHVLMRVGDDGAVSLTTSSSDDQMSCAIAAETVQTPGAATAPAAKLLALLVLQSGVDLVRMKSSSGKVLIQCGQNRRFTLRSLPPEDFPIVDTDPDARTSVATLSNEAARNLFSRVSFAMAAVTDPRTYLAGICLDLEPHILTAAATDGARLAVARQACDGYKGAPQQAIVARKTVKLLVALVNRTEMSLTMRLRRGGCRFEVGDIALESNCVSGEYPNYRSVMERESAGAMRVERAEFAGLIQQLLPIHEGSKPCAITLDRLANGSLSLTASGSGDCGACEITPEIVDDAGVLPLPAAFSGKFLRDAVGGFGGERILLSAGKGEMLTSLIITETDGSGSIQVVAPTGAGKPKERIEAIKPRVAEAESA